MTKSIAYGLRWLMLELARRSHLVPAETRARYQTRLIERGIEKGLELQRQVDAIEETRRMGYPDGVLPTALPTPPPALPADSSGGQLQRAAWRRGGDGDVESRPLWRRLWRRRRQASYQG